MVLFFLSLAEKWVRDVLFQQAGSSVRKTKLNLPWQLNGFDLFHCNYCEFCFQEWSVPQQSLRVEFLVRSVCDRIHVWSCLRAQHDFLRRIN